jgi:hypothetical protein
VCKERSVTVGKQEVSRTEVSVADSRWQQQAINTVLHLQARAITPKLVVQGVRESAQGHVAADIGELVFGKNGRHLPEGAP